MTDETEQTDDHLALIARANGKAPADRHDTRQTNRQSVRFDLGDLKEQLKTPLNAVLVGGVLLLAFALLLSGYHYGGEIATARADAQEGKAFGHQAEREAKLSREDVQRLEVHTEVLTALLQARGYNPPKMPTLHKEGDAN